MKEFKLNKNSWHFKLATKFGGLDKHDTETNICRYFWKGIVLGSAFITFLAGVASGVLFILGGVVYHWYLLFTTGVLESGVVISLGLALVAGIVYICKVYLEHRSDKRRALARAKREAESAGTYVEPEPGFVKQVYTSFKQKTCHKIVFESADKPNKWDGS